MDMITNETKKRISIYHDLGPGTENCEVKPITLKTLVPSFYFTLGLVALFIWGALSVYPSYFPN